MIKGGITIHNKIIVNKIDDEEVIGKNTKESDSKFISEQYKKLISDKGENPFTSDYAKSVYDRYMNLGKKSSDEKISSYRADNNGSIDTTAWADARRQEMSYLDAAMQNVIDYEDKHDERKLKALESFADKNFKDYEKVEQTRLNTAKVLETEAKISGETPTKLRNNPYINPETKDVYDKDIDYQEKINTVKKKISETDDETEKDRLNKEYNNLVDARYTKIINNPEYMKYIKDGDIVSLHKTSEQKNETRNAETDKKLSEDKVKITDIEATKDKYIADKEYDASVYKANIQSETDKYVADLDHDAKIYDSNNELKEQALQAMVEREKNNKKSVSASSEKKAVTDTKLVSESGWMVPVNTNEYKISSEFGVRDTDIPGASKNHTAVDIACAKDTDVVAAKDGVVTFSGWKDGYGNTVEISHDNNIVTKYHHMANTPDVKKGDIVKSGATIGKVGSTGISSGNHLDFQIFEGDTPIDPKKYYGDVLEK